MYSSADTPTSIRVRNVAEPAAARRRKKKPKKYDTSGRAIDWIFSNTPLIDSNLPAFEEPVSDHLPVMVEMKIVRKCQTLRLPDRLAYDNLMRALIEDTDRAPTIVALHGLVKEGIRAGNKPYKKIRLGDRREAHPKENAADVMKAGYEQRYRERFKQQLQAVAENRFSAQSK